MRVLVTWGSKRGGTEGIARMLAEGLRADGVDVELSPAQRVRSLDGFDGVVAGGALYAYRWHPAARAFVARHESTLRRLPVWLFSSGPLDDSADERVIPPVRPVEALMERIGAQGHVTFGGRLAADARGFPARAMAKTHAGDWRRPERVRAWASAIARALPSARPRPAIAQPGHAPARVITHAIVGWALCAAVMVTLLRVADRTTAFVVHDIFVPLAFAAIAVHYFRARGAREPLTVAMAFAGIIVLLDVVIVAGLAQHSLVMLASIAGFWLPVALGFLVTFAVGSVVSMTPATRADRTARRRQNFPAAAKRTP